MMIGRWLRLVADGPEAIANVISATADLAKIEGQILVKTFTLDLQNFTSGLIWAVVMATCGVITLFFLSLGAVIAVYAIYPNLPFWVAPIGFATLFFAAGFFAWQCFRHNIKKVGSSLSHLKRITSQISKSEDYDISMEQQH